MGGQKKTVTRDDARKFCDLCVLARASYQYLRFLYEFDPEHTRLISEIDHMFSGDLQAILRDSVFSYIRKISDPERSARRENPTTESFVSNFDFPSAPRDERKLAFLHGRIREFREKILAYRPQRMSCPDRAAAPGDRPLGAATNQEWNQFWLNLQDFVEIIHRRYINPSGQFRLNGLASDTHSLIIALNGSAASAPLNPGAATVGRCPACYDRNIDF